MWVVACRNESERPVIYECIEAIQRWHPDAHILIVDSDSPSKDYFDWATERGCNVADIRNHGYAHGAFRFGVRAYPNEDWYALIFDSMIVTANLDDLKSRPVVALRHWSNREHDWGWDSESVHLSVWGNRQLQRMGIEYPASYTGIMGPAFFAQRQVIDRLEAIGYYDTEIEDSYQHCGLERVAGICLEALDYSVTESLQGVHTTHWDTYDESFIKKLNMARA